MSTAVGNTAANLAGKTVLTAEQAATITGLLAFSRGASAPFTVNSGAAKVTNLDADFLDGFSSLRFQPTVVNTTVTGTQVNFDPGIVAGPMIVRCNNASLLTIDGFLATNAYNGQLLWVVREGAGQVDLTPAALSAATPANQFTNYVTGVNGTSLGTNGVGLYRYSTGSSTWRMIYHEQGGWVSYTPSFNGTLGNGTVAGTYRVSGTEVSFQQIFTFGSTSVMGAVFGLPLQTTKKLTPSVAMTDISAALVYGGTGAIASATTFLLNNAGTGANVGALVPFTWATGDLLEAAGRYEIQ